jgi:hypothetical protein
MDNSQANKHKTYIEQYLAYTNDYLPSLASTTRKDWPVKFNHCFQRIVLDNICQDVWYEHISKPAYLHLTTEQAQQALRLCEQIYVGKANLDVLNQNSLRWRNKQMPLNF